MGIGGDFLGHKEHEPQKKKIDKLTIIPNSNCFLKVITKTMKMKAADWEKIFAMFVRQNQIWN